MRYFIAATPEYSYLTVTVEDGLALDSATQLITTLDTYTANLRPHPIHIIFDLSALRWMSPAFDSWLALLKHPRDLLAIPHLVWVVVVTPEQAEQWLPSLTDDLLQRVRVVPSYEAALALINIDQKRMARKTS